MCVCACNAVLFYIYLTLGLLRWVSDVESSRLVGLENIPFELCFVNLEACCIFDVLNVWVGGFCCISEDFGMSVQCGMRF